MKHRGVWAHREIWVREDLTDQEATRPQPGTRTRSNTNPYDTKPVLRVEVCARALRPSQNVKKRCVPCVFALLKQVHGRVL